MTDELRAAVEAALLTLTGEQARAAHALLDALTPLTPPMEEPTWPGAHVIAGCRGSARMRLHVRRNDGPVSGWECVYCCASSPWGELVDPRPLTPAEYAEHGIPMPCTHPSDEDPRRTATGPKVYAMLAIADVIEGLASTLRDAIAVPPSASRCAGCGSSAVGSDEMCSACLARGAGDMAPGPRS